MTTTATQFRRTRFTILSYLLLGYFGILLVMLSALMPFVSDRLELNYGLTSLHLTLSAIGAFMVGTYGDWLARKIGNGRAAWMAALLGTAALAGIALGNALWITLPLAFFHGTGSGGTAQFTSAALSDEQTTHRAKAIAESNVISATGVAVGPLLVGGLLNFGFGLVAAVIVSGVLLAVLAGYFQGVRFPQPLATVDNTGNRRTDEPLPLMFWMFCVLLFIGVSIEWMTLFWTPDFLSDVIGYERGTAATLISVQAVAIVVGRLAGLRLLNYMTNRTLLVLAFGWVLLSYPVYLFSPLPLLNVMGLFSVGLGIGNLFPLCFSGAMVAAGAHTGRASARVSLFGSGAILIMPNLVGNLADQITIRPAMTVAMLLCVIAIGIGVAVNRMQDSKTVPQPML
ncbi:MAG: MFS transporter [Chloroflexota bacterium]